MHIFMLELISAFYAIHILFLLALLSLQLKCSSNIDSIHYLGLTNSFHQDICCVGVLMYSGE